MKGNEVLTHATVWMNFGNVLSARNQVQKGTCYMIPFIQNIQNRQIQRDGQQINGSQKWRGW